MEIFDSGPGTSVNVKENNDKTAHTFLLWVFERSWIYTENLTVSNELTVGEF